MGRVRDSNEDRYLVREERRDTLIAVADGVAGQAGGEIASAAAVEALAKRYFEARPEVSRSDALAAAMREANAAVLSAAGTTGQHGAASTLVAAAVHGRNAVIANLGDSRAYLLRDVQIRLLTTDHAGQFARSITRFVGDPRGVQPDVFVETLHPRDRLLLCSDGLTRHVTDEEIAEHARRGAIDRAASSLVELANSRGGEDNITVVLYASPGPFLIADAGRSLTGAILAVLIAIVAIGTIAALIFASGAYLIGQ